MTEKLKVRIPYTFGDTGKDLKPFTQSYPEYGQGGESYKWLLLKKW